HMKQPNLEYYNPDTGWEWDWDKWYEETEEDITEERGNPLSLDLRPPLSDFDHNDVIILKSLIAEPDIILKELAKRLDLSESQVNKRIKRLEREGIIKEYRPIIDLFDDIMHITLILEMQRNAGAVIHALNRLPFRIGFAIDPPHRWSVKVGLAAQDTLRLFEGLDRIRDSIVDYMFQIEIPVRKTEHEDFCERFNPRTGSWDLPMTEYINIIRKFTGST
ncbi:winged helix-turn-helix transcriptional regulator, partial [Candidatus Thorarchaeota archaeon]